MKTQNQEILEALKDGIVMTPKYALNNFGCMRLAARVHDLRAKGHAIHADTRKFKGRNGRKGKVGVYWMDQ